MAANAIFAAQAMLGHHAGFLILTIAIDNVSTAMGGAALVAYLSSLCNRAFTATQYALLSALATVPRTFLASSGGSLAENIGWVHFFLMNAMLAIPGLVLLLWLMRGPGRVPAGG
jgi:PAT family beta-lactamase induction signal transducer AmpG